MTGFSIWVCTILLLVAIRPPAPVWAGAALVAMVLSGASEDLSSPSARKRWSAFKRMCGIAAFGITLMVLGSSIASDGFAAPAYSSESARHAIISLAVYCAGMLGAPVAAWVHLSHRESAKSPKKSNNQHIRTLSDLAERKEGATRAAV